MDQCDAQLSVYESRLTVGMDRDSGHRVHVRLCDILDDDGNIIVPPSDRLVVRGRQEPPVVVHPGDGVDRPQMLIVLLRDLLLPQVVLRVDFISLARPAKSNRTKTPRQT